mmetsp:Transcript_56926/g.128993  ORF Transcript_56926/g.128993 Transcript_56926/m.128993 type:complete len:517 (-) Transcript_56926:415-1965(-)
MVSGSRRVLAVLLGATFLLWAATNEFTNLGLGSWGSPATNYRSAWELAAEEPLRYLPVPHPVWRIEEPRHLAREVPHLNALRLLREGRSSAGPLGQAARLSLAPRSKPRARASDNSTNRRYTVVGWRPGVDLELERRIGWDSDLGASSAAGDDTSGERKYRRWVDRWELAPFRVAHDDALCQHSGDQTQRVCLANQRRAKKAAIAQAAAAGGGLEMVSASEAAAAAERASFEAMASMFGARCSLVPVPGLGAKKAWAGDVKGWPGLELEYSPGGGIAVLLENERAVDHNIYHALAGNQELWCLLLSSRALDASTAMHLSLGSEPLSSTGGGLGSGIGGPQLGRGEGVTLVHSLGGAGVPGHPEASARASGRWAGDLITAVVGRPEATAITATTSGFETFGLANRPADRPAVPPAFGKAPDGAGGAGETRTPLRLVARQAFRLAVTEDPVYGLGVAGGSHWDSWSFSVDQPRSPFSSLLGHRVRRALRVQERPRHGGTLLLLLRATDRLLLDKHTKR